MDAFLAAVERRAFHIARMAVGDADEALDIVQDSMIRLVRSYSQRPSGDWKPLFYRILNNRIVDTQRRNTVRRRVMAWISPRRVDDDAPDPLELAPGPVRHEPDTQLQLDGAMDALEAAVAELPARQREAFLLRAVEGLNVAGTATAMGCSAGSVKTHYSRAVHSLRATLGEHWKS